MKYHIFLSIFFFLIVGFVFSQDIPFVPPCYNYQANEYNAGNQNWALAQDNNGIVYVANNKGLLCFDGANWELKQLPNHLGIKSIFVDNEADPERIYVGSFEEFGYFYRDEFNQLLYKSLKQMLGTYPFQNDEIWTIHKIHKKLYFQSFSSYFVYDGDNVKPFNPRPAPLYFFNYQNNLFAQFIDDNLYRYHNHAFELMAEKSLLKDNFVVAMLPFKKDVLLATANQGVFVYDETTGNVRTWECENGEDLKKAVINRAIAIDSLYIFGTLNDGIYAINKDGNQRWHITTQNGLQNNTVLGLMRDSQENLWVALDNGIAMIPINSELSFFQPRDTQIGMLEDIMINNNELYIASNYGVFKYDEKKQSFISLPDFSYQTWFIRKFDNQVFVGQNTGSSFLENNKRNPILASGAGGMDIKSGVIHGKNVLIESTYTYLSVFLRDSDGRWTHRHNASGFFDLINHLEIDHTGNIWASHMYKGIYRLNLDDELKNVVNKTYFDTLDTLSKNRKPIKVMKLRGRIVLTDGAKFYTFDDIKQQIVSFDQLNTALPDFADTYRIIEINDTSFWFVREKEYNIVRYSSGKYEAMESVPATLLHTPPNEGRRNVYITESGASLICLNGGICKYQSQKQQQKSFAKFQIATIFCYNRKNDLKIPLSLAEKNIIRYKNNNIIVTFWYPNFSKNKIQIQSYLESYDNFWNNTSKNRTITYTNLPAGHYTLKTRIIDEFGKTIDEKNYTLKIKKPWYRSFWAYLVYSILLFLFLIFLILLYIRITLQRRKKTFEKEEKERLAQLDKQEKTISRLKNEKLESELVFKGKELASASMLVINHEKVLSQLKQEIQKLMLAGKLAHKQATELINLIEQHITEKDEWALFEENFDLIHKNFFRNLQEKYPDLTPTDLKLCALLRLNYSTKEIAHMLNLTPRGVEAGRYRLRKKLNLTENENLASFIINFT